MIKNPLLHRLTLFAALLPLLAAGCAGMDIDQTMGYAKAAGQASAAVMPISLEEEAEIGQAVAARVAGRYGVLNSGTNGNILVTVDLANEVLLLRQRLVLRDIDNDFRWECRLEGGIVGASKRAGEQHGR